MRIKIKAYFLIGLFCLISLSLCGQDQKLADSLVDLYHSGKFSDKLQILRDISENASDPETGLYYSELLIEEAEKLKNNRFLHSGYLQKGNHLESMGEYSSALEAYFRSGEFAQLSDDDLGQSAVLIAIADTYSAMENHTNAKSYYKKGIASLRKNSEDSIVLATALLNAGDEYFKSNDYAEALSYFKESGTIFENLNFPIGMAYNDGNMGMVYAEIGKDELAEKSINRAITTLEELEDYYPISVYLTYMADIYFRKKDLDAAFEYSKRSLELARNYGLKDQISEANLKLSEFYKKTGDFENAYHHYTDYVLYRDSVRNIENIQEMARIRTENEVGQKQAEVDLLEQKERNQKIIVIATAIALFLIGLLALGLFRRNRFISRTKAIIEKERNRSDQLLLNILPEDTAKELKDSGKVKSKRFESVSVLFADFVGFTRYSEKLSPEEVVDSVDFYFSKFDEIVEKYGIEKIKTLGDCYMCAAGLPFPDKLHAQKMVLAAFEMLDFVKSFKAKSEIELEEINFDIKIGINSGPVVAGVVGTKKFAYDIWGDTVNIASRMESHSEPGFINVSESTCKLISKDFDCDYRGEVEVKNKGLMKMYYVRKANNKQLEKTFANSEALKI